MTETPVQFRSDMGVSLVDHMGSDRSIVRAARVSTVGANEGEGGEKLIAYLIREGHWSPLMHTALTVLVEVPISTARQIFKHTVGVVFNETSARYREVEPVFHLPARERPLTQTGKVGAYVFEQGTDQQYEAAINARKLVSAQAWSLYQTQLALGIAREVARDVLPVSIYTQFYMTLNLRSALHFLDLRQHSSAQYEIREVADRLEEIVASKFPITHAAWKSLNNTA